MNIVIDAREALLERVGVAVYARNVIEQMILLAGLDINFILLGPKNSTSPFMKRANVVYHPIAPQSTASLREKILWYYSLPSLLKSFRASVYFGNFTKLPFSPKMKCPVVVTAHDAASINTEQLVGDKLARLKNLMFVRGWVRSSTHIICISEYCRQEFSELFGNTFKKKSSVIYHGLPEEFKLFGRPSEQNIKNVRDKYGIKDRYIFSLGTVSPKKNYSRLIQSISKLERSDLHLVISGKLSFDSEQILKTVESCGLQDRVHFLGSAPTEDVHALMGGAECFVFPSLYEGFGLPLLEAFYLEVPVISSNATCLPEIAGDAALFIDPLDVEDIKNKISELLCNDDLSADLVRRGRLRVEQFTWAVSASKHLQVLQQVSTK